MFSFGIRLNYVKVFMGVGGGLYYIDELEVWF